MLGLERPLAVRRLGGHRRDAPVPDVKAIDVVAQQHLMAALDDAIAAHLPHLARTETRVLEFMDERLDRRSSASLSDVAVRIAFASESPWMRCAAHSARISVHGMPQTFSVYVLKKIS